MVYAHDAAAVVADAAVRLSRALHTVGWRTHRHPEDLWRVEPESEPVPDHLIPPAVRQHADAIIRRLNADALADQPRPVLPTNHPSINLDPDGDILLPLPIHIEPDQLEQTCTWSRDMDEAIRLWVKVVPELASNWAMLPTTRPLALGLLFLGPKDRLIYWPRSINRLLSRIPVSYGIVDDLVRIAALVGIKIDLQAAYRSLRISLSHCPYYGACLDGVFMLFTRAPFGARCSPAHFVISLAATLAKVRNSFPATEAALQALSAFVDDLGASAGGQALPEALARLYELVDRLVSALVQDGWWISLAKCFLRPAYQLYYTGVVANFPAGTLVVHPTKAAKLRMLMSNLTMPSERILADASAAANIAQSRTVPPGLKVACRNLSDLPMAVAALPLHGHEWPIVPTTIIVDRNLSQRELGELQGFQGTVTTVPITDAWHAVLNCVIGIPPTQPPRAAALILIATTDAYKAYSVCTEAPPRSHWRRDIAVVVVYAGGSDPTADGGDIRWFDPRMALPHDWPHRVRALPPLGTPPPALPGELATPPIIRHHGSPDINRHEFAALSTILGYLSWLGTMVPHLSAWRGSIDTTHSSGVWSRDATAAITFLWDIAPWLPRWERQVRTRDIHDGAAGVLRITADTATCSWAAVIPPSTRYPRPRAAAGSLPFRANIASTLAREAWAGLLGTRAAIAMGARFSEVELENDNQGLTCTAGTGHGHTAEAAVPMRGIAAYDWQGIAFRFVWKRRSTALQPLADALSPAAGAEVWPLRTFVASYIYDCLPEGWSHDGPSAADRTFSARYYTGRTPEADRALIFEQVATATEARDGVGWQGDIHAWIPAAGEVMFAHGLWSDMPRIAELTLTHRPMIVIIPTECRGEWWQPAWATIRTHSRAFLPLPRRATRRPGQPHSSDPRAEALGETEDFRPLSVAFINIDMIRNPMPRPDRPGRPQWWSPWVMTADGDVESNPGPVPLRPHLSIFSHSRTPATRQDEDRPDRRPERSAWKARTPTATANPTIPTVVPPTAMIPRTRTRSPWQPAVPPTPTTNPMTPTLDPPAAMIPRTRAPNPWQPMVSQQARRPAAPQQARTASRRKRLRSPPRQAVDAPLHHTAPLRARHASHAPQPATAQATDLSPAQRVYMEALAPTVPVITSIGAWLRMLQGFTARANVGITTADVPTQLQAFVALARATIRRKAMQGGNRPEKGPRYMMQMARGLGILDAPFNLPTVDALATALAVRRLDPQPPFGWRRVTQAASVKSDLSAIASISRKAGLHGFPPVCGPTAADYLSARGAGDTTEHSQAWPIHLSDLVAVEPDYAKDPAAWHVWAALIVLAFFCLRPGVLPHLLREMLVAYDGGWILTWRFVSKTSAGDVLDPELRSAVVRVSAARNPLLTRVMARLPQKGLMFPGATSEALNAFVQNAFPACPKGFTLRTYGVRVAADLEAVELGLPEDLTNALFWWRRLCKSSRLYYGGLAIARMYQFSEARTRVAFVHLRAGRYDARIRPGSGPLPDFRALITGHLPSLPPQVTTDLDAAWDIEATTVADERKARASKQGLAALWQALPADPDADDASDAGSDASLDCGRCKRHVDRHSNGGTLCSIATCNWMLCTKCHGAKAVGILCPEHDPTARRPPRPRR